MHLAVAKKTTEGKLIVIIQRVNEWVREHLVRINNYDALNHLCNADDDKAILLLEQ